MAYADSLHSGTAEASSGGQFTCAGRYDPAYRRYALRGMGKEMGISHSTQRRAVSITCGLVLTAVAAASTNISHRILDVERSVTKVTPEMRRRLDRIMDEGCAAVRKIAKPTSGWDKGYALAVFKSIDDTLISNHILYPDKGLVRYFADSLIPFTMPKSRKKGFFTGHNVRRKAMIEATFPGPFYAADCDTACYYYLGIAEKMRLPIYLVELPMLASWPGHNYLVWREGKDCVYWETMDGWERDNERPSDIPEAVVLARGALVDMTTDEVMGYVHSVVASSYERSGDYPRAVRELTQAHKLYAGSLVIANQYAWDIAVGKNLLERDHQSALQAIQFYLKLLEDPSARDTLAAVYASEGMYELAVKEQQAAIAGLKDESSRKNFESRLALYKTSKPYRQKCASPAKPGAIFSVGASEK